MLAKAGFILVVDQQAFVGVGRFELIQTFRQFFYLKFSIAAGSVSG